MCNPCCPLQLDAYMPEHARTVRISPLAPPTDGDERAGAREGEPVGQAGPKNCQTARQAGRQTSKQSPDHTHTMKQQSKGTQKTKINNCTPTTKEKTGIGWNWRNLPHALTDIHPVWTGTRVHTVAQTHSVSLKIVQLECVAQPYKHMRAQMHIIFT